MMTHGTDIGEWRHAHILTLFSVFICLYPSDIVYKVSVMLFLVGSRSMYRLHEIKCSRLFFFFPFNYVVKSLSYSVELALSTELGKKIIRKVVIEVLGNLAYAI